jgi:calmodulin
MSTAKCQAAARCLQFPAGREHRTTITAAEFKEWLKQFDTNRDGRISWQELREAIRRRGAWFPNVKAWCVVRRADRDRNGYVDEWEMENLIGFAEKELGFVISDPGTPSPGIRKRRW